MRPIPLQLSVSTLLLLVACSAVNLWLFRFGPLVGLLGLSVSKHVVIAWLCQVLGVNQRRRESERLRRENEAARAEAGVPQPQPRFEPPPRIAMGASEPLR